MDELNPATVPEEEAKTESPEVTTEEQEEQSNAKLVKMSLDSGVAPIEIRYSQINSCYRKFPVVEGVISPEKYSYAADETDTGLRLAKYNLKAAMKAVEQFIIAGRKIEFVSLRVSPRMVLELDFYGAIKSILDESDFKFPDKLCLEFPRTVLFEDEEKVRMALLSMKLLKVKTMMTGCGEKDSPVTPLINLPFDYLLLSPHLTAIINSRDKGTTVASFISFLRGLPSNVIADGVYNDEQITAMSRADCFGYIPSSGYKGSVEHGRLRMPLNEALEQKEEEEF